MRARFARVPDGKDDDRLAIEPVAGDVSGSSQRNQQFAVAGLLQIDPSEPGKRDRMAILSRVTRMARNAASGLLPARQM